VPREARDPVLLGLTASGLFGGAWYLLGGRGGLPYWLVTLTADVLYILFSAKVSRLGGTIGRAQPEPVLGVGEHAPRTPAPLVRRFWRAMTVAGLFFTAGDVVQVRLVLTDPGAGTVGTAQSALVAGGVLAVIAAMLTHPLGATGLERKRLWLDAGTVLTSVAVFAWYFLVSGAVGADPASTVTSIVGSALMLMAAFGLLKLILSGTAPFTLAAAAVGGTCAVVIGLLTALNPVLPHVADRGPWMVVHMLPGILFAATPRVQELQMRSRPDALAPRPRRAYSRLPYLAVVATQLLLVNALLRHGSGLRAWGATIGAITITALVLTRQVLAFHDNARLVDTLDESLLRLRRQEERFRSLVQHASDITMVTGKDGTIGYASPALERVLGFPPPYRSMHDVVNRIHPDDLPGWHRLNRRLRAAPGRDAAVQVRVRHATGSWRWLDVVAVNLLDNPSVDGIVYNARDVTEARELQDRLRHEATHDALTDLANRALFDERVRRVHEDGTETVTIFVIDLDDFKKINDSYGHAVGDALLVAVARRLRACVRPGDTVARLGGDEFAVLLADTTREHARVLADRMVLALAAPVQVEGHLLAAGASIGIATGDRADADRLLRDADAAMYTAKHSGKGGYSVTSGTVWEQMS
jgi:diguanylate cyclase (GGDEF)-like protein/PAS domain S-box-containing protein